MGGLDGGVGFWWWGGLLWWWWWWWWFWVQVVDCWFGLVEAVVLWQRQPGADGQLLVSIGGGVCVVAAEARDCIQ